MLSVDDSELPMSMLSSFFLSYFHVFLIKGLIASVQKDALDPRMA